MKKNIFIFAVIAVLILGSATASFAQVKETKLLTNEEFFEKSDFIIEGKAIGNNSYSYDINGNYDPNDIYTSSLFVVNYVYKNNSNTTISSGDTLNIIWKSGMIYKKVKIEINGYFHDYEEEIWSNLEKPTIDVALNEYAICFFTKQLLPEDPAGNKNSRFLQVNVLQNKAGAAIKTQGSIRGLNGLKFPNRDSLYLYMKQFEKYGVDGYYEVEKYYQKKRREIDDFKRNYPQMSIPKTERIYEIDSLRTETIIKIIRTPIPTIKEFKGVKKIDDLQIELDDFQRLERQKIDSILNEINILKKSIIEKKNTLRSESDTKLWVIIHNQQIYYDNVLDMNFLEFDYC